MELPQKLKQVLKAKRVLTVQQLCSATDRAEITVKQALAELDYLTSYDHNSRFYTLRSICSFDQHGIWRHTLASFTRHGTLSALLVALVDESDAGYTGSELETITGVAVSSPLGRLIKTEKLIRLRQQRQYIYFTARLKRLQQVQIRARFGSAKPVAYADRDTTTEELKKTIVVLLEIIRSRPRTVQKLKDILGRRHPEIPGSFVSQICRQYGVGVKKKINPYELFDSAVKLAQAFEERTGRVFEFHFVAERQYCPICGRDLEYYKTTNTRSFGTIRFGQVAFRQSQMRCPVHTHSPVDGTPLSYGSTFLTTLVAPGWTVGLDVIVYVGEQRFLKYRQVEEVYESLLARGIDCGLSSVSRWADFFLAAVECLHYTKTEKLKKFIKARGGYLLHIDATTETKSDTVFVCVDRILGAVLLTERISSENEEEIIQALRRLKALFGSPMGIMRDMSGRIAAAVQEVFPGVPDRICQFHFLRDIGKDLLGKSNVQLGHTMVRLKINADLQKA